jgi:hypothetical protein
MLASLAGKGRTNRVDAATAIPLIGPWKGDRCGGGLVQNSINRPRQRRLVRLGARNEGGGRPRCWSKTVKWRSAWTCSSTNVSRDVEGLGDFGVSKMDSVRDLGMAEFVLVRDLGKEEFVLVCDTAGSNCSACNVIGET